VSRRPTAVIGRVLLVATVVLAAACGSDGDDGDAAPSTSRPVTSTTGPPVSGRTELTVEGEATRAVADPTATPTLLPFSGTLRCADSGATGTGMFATTATATCAAVIEQREVFAAAPDDQGQICTEIYGGPQLATIKGSVDGTPVDIEVERSDGCGIARWTELEFLLGPPER
jgi:hypothetical protein